ncbi:splicing factor 3B subunit 2, partial [Silurus meridionalis]
PREELMDRLKSYMMQTGVMFTKPNMTGGDDKTMTTIPGLPPMPLMPSMPLPPGMGVLQAMGMMGGPPPPGCTAAGAREAARAVAMRTSGPPPPGVSMLSQSSQRQRVPPPPGEDSREKSRKRQNRKKKRNQEKSEQVEWRKSETEKDKEKEPEVEIEYMICNLWSWYSFILQLVARPDGVEMHDVTAHEPKLLVHLKAMRNTVPVPRHLCFKRKYLQGKRGIEKPPFELPEFIKRTGIQEMREALQEKGKEIETRLKEKKPGDLSDKLSLIRLCIALGMLTESFSIFISFAWCNPTL